MTTTLYDQLERRILLLDGGFGTMVQGYGLQEEDYRGRRFAGPQLGKRIHIHYTNPPGRLQRGKGPIPRSQRPAAEKIMSIL